MRFFWIVFMAVTICPVLGLAGPPRDNPYDVIAKMLQPFLGVLLAENGGTNRAAEMTLVMTDVSGRLPKEMKGARLEAAVQFPDKVRLTAPVLGENVIVCRNGNEVWAVPGAKVEFLLKKFDVKPAPIKKTNTPLYLPITPQQAVFLPAIFSVRRADVAEVGSLQGEELRVITATLMPELAKAIKSEGFEVRVWVADGYAPRRFDIIQPDFTATVDVVGLRFAPSLPATTWLPPEGVTDIYRTHADMLDATLFVVMNSLGLKDNRPPGVTPPQSVP